MWRHNWAPPFLAVVCTLVTPQNLLRTAPQNYKDERFSSILKMDYGGKCSVLGCTGNADTFHNLPKEPDTWRAWLMFFYEDPCEVRHSCIHLLKPFHQGQFWMKTFDNLKKDLLSRCCWKVWKQIVTKIKMHLPKCFFIWRMWLHYLTHKWN